MMKSFLLSLLALFSGPWEVPGPAKLLSDYAKRLQAYHEQYKEDSTASVSMGQVHDGALVNGKLFPFNGKNFRYFDTMSYIHDRAFLNDKVRSSVIAAYKALDTLAPGRQFRIMECSNKNGGQMSGHRTHQNGLSIDFMTPLKKDSVPFYLLDDMGGNHYLLDFDSSGVWTQDSSISIDFDMMALHILTLEKCARKKGIRIVKVIWKLELKPELFATPNGKKLKRTGIYFTRNHTPAINRSHDDHYHIDFGPAEKK